MLQFIADRFGRRRPHTQETLLAKYKRLQHRKHRYEYLGKVDIQLEHDIFETSSELSQLLEVEDAEAAEIAEIVAELERESIL